MAKKSKKKSNEELVKLHELQYPFAAIENNGVFKIVAGNTIISKNDFATLEEAKEYVDSKPYELIINISCYCMEQTLKENEK